MFVDIVCTHAANTRHGTKWNENENKNKTKTKQKKQYKQKQKKKTKNEPTDQQARNG